MSHALVVIGASLGGLHAVGTVLAALPGGFPLPVAVVQHRSPDAGDALQMLLQLRCALPVREAEDKAPIEPGTVYLALPDYHLLVEDGHFALSTDEPESGARPSIDVLCETAAEAFGARTIGVVLTGTGSDGAKGLAAIERAGGVAIVQDPLGAQAGGMPAAALASVPRALVLALQEIAPRLVELARR